MMSNYVELVQHNSPNLTPQFHGRVFHGYGGHSSPPRPHVCSSRSSMGGYFTGTGTSNTSPQIVPANCPRKYPSKLKITCMEVFSRGRFAGTWNTREIPVKYPWNTRPWNWAVSWENFIKTYYSRVGFRYSPIGFNSYSAPPRPLWPLQRLN